MSSLSRSAGSIIASCIARSRGRMVGPACNRAQALAARGPIANPTLVNQLASINSADEAAVWARRNLPAKNTLTAGDARIVEELFAARLFTIGDGLRPGGTPDGLAPDGPPHAAPDQSVGSRPDADTSKRKLRRRPRSSLPALPSVLWAKRFACAIRNTGSSCCGSPALCAAECRQIRITSRLRSRVRSESE